MRKFKDPVVQMGRTKAIKNQGNACNNTKNIFLSPPMGILVLINQYIEQPFLFKLEV